MSLHAHIKPIVYGTFNVGVGCGIVFANKAVLSIFNFKFVYCLTLIHTIVTMVGMWMFAAGGIFEIKRFTALQVCALSPATMPSMPCMYTLHAQHLLAQFAHDQILCFPLGLPPVLVLFMQVAPLAAAFVGYVVFWNLSLQVNSVGFYQLSKIMVLPTVAALEVIISLTCSFT